MQKTQNLQDLFLNQARKEKLAVTMFLMNGFQLRGVIRGFDGFTVILDSDGKQQMIYKHAISTVVPVRPLPLEAPESGFLVFKSRQRLSRAGKAGKKERV